MPDSGRWGSRPRSLRRWDGLFPPRSITSTGATDTTISISWDPGTVTHHIDGYKVYWDTDSGASTKSEGNDSIIKLSDAHSHRDACHADVARLHEDVGDG